MGIFDLLINNNKNPKEDMEYIYLLDEVWKPGKIGSYPIKQGSIVTDVTKLGNDSFEFIDKESGEKFRTNYGWTLAESTPENIERIKAYEECALRLNEIEKERDSLRSKVLDLNGSSKF